MKSPPEPTVAELIADRLRDEILAGNPPRGEKIATEWELVERFGVTRVAVREALARLQAIGLVRARQGSGVRVRDWRQEGGVDLAAPLLRLCGIRSPQGRALLTQLLDLRRSIAVQLVRAAARRRDAEGVMMMRAALEKARSSVGDLQKFVEADLTFSRGLALASVNHVALLLVNSIARALAVDPELAEVLFADRARNLAGLEVLLAAVEAGDETTAETFALQAIELLNATVLASLSDGAGPKSTRAPSAAAPSSPRSRRLAKRPRRRPGGRAR
jgi:DNA-binding FadR family transcriptional regulator